MSTTKTTPLEDAIELRRCIDSTSGSLNAILEGMPEGHPQAFALNGLLEGGMPAIYDLIDELVKAHGGPDRDDDPALTKSFHRGYQVSVLLTREQEGEDVPREAYKQDPEEFVREIWEAKA